MVSPGTYPLIARPGHWADPGARETLAIMGRGLRPICLERLIVVAHPPFAPLLGLVT